MSSGLGYPDWQKIQQWVGAPLDQATGAAIGAGAINLGPYNLASWASIVLAIKPTGGKVTVTIRQKINGGPGTLELDQSIVCNAGTTTFEAFVLFGDVVSLTLQGDTLGETVDYAVYPSNTTTNAQVITNATINVQHNEVLVAAEQTLDFVDATGAAFTVTDDAPNTRVKVAMPASPMRQVDRGGSVSVSNTAVETAIFNMNIPAGMLNGTGFARALAFGSFLNATGAAQDYPRFKVYLNGVNYLNTGSIGSGVGVASNGVYMGYELEVFVLGGGAANQYVALKLHATHGGAPAASGLATLGAGGWTVVGNMAFAQVNSAAGAAAAAGIITVGVSVVNFVASPNYQTVLDTCRLEAVQA